MATITVTKPLIPTHIKEGANVNEDPAQRGIRTSIIATSGDGYFLKPSFFDGEVEKSQELLFILDDIPHDRKIKKVELKFQAKRGVTVSFNSVVHFGWGVGSYSGINSTTGLPNPLVKFYEADELFEENGTSESSYITYDSSLGFTYQPGSITKTYYKSGLSDSFQDYSIILYEYKSGSTTKTLGNSFANYSSMTGTVKKGFILKIWLLTNLGVHLHLRGLSIDITYETEGANLNLSTSPSNGGTVSGEGAYERHSTVNITASPNQGYTFSYWKDLNTGSTYSSNPLSVKVQTTDENYQAVFTPKNYTVKAQSSNTSYGTVSYSGGTCSYDSMFTSTASPTNANYQFDGWYKDGSLVTLSTTLSEKVYGDATYIAQFSRKQYTITYVSDGGTSTPDPQKFYIGDSVTLAPAIQKDPTITNPSYDFTTYFYKQGGVWGNGETSINQIVYPKKETSYTFYRWRNNSTDYWAEGSYRLSGDTTFTAVWTPSPSYTITAPAVSHNDSTDSRTITFHYNDGTNRTTTATSSNTTSYTLKGWYTSANGGDKKISSNGGSYSPDSGETLYAQWNSSSTDYSKVTFPTFSKDGYTLLGFTDQKSSTTVKYTAGQEIAVESVEWYAIWSLDTFTLSYDVNGGSGTFSDQTGNVTYTIRSTRPKRTGYNFQGWSLTKGAKTADYYPGGTITISKNTTLYAVWTQETISSKTSKDTTISYAGQIYWYKFTPTTAGEYVMYSTGSSDTYGYIYNSSGTSLDVDDDEGDSTNFRVSYSLSANTPYYFGVKYLSSSSTGTIRINLGPVYTISYNNNGVSTSQSKDWNKNITLSSNTLTRDYYEFKGWSTNASATEHDYTAGATFSANENTTLHAVWVPIDYSIEYKLNGGKVAVTNLTSYNVETNSFTLNNPTKDGYTFTGWSGTGLTGTNNKNVTITKGSNGDRTYTANWKQNIYTVTLDNQSANTAGTTAIYLKYNSGWFSNNQAQATTSISKITIPQKNGYTFNGYYPQKDGAGGNPIIDANGNINFNSTSLLEDKTYYAYWTINYYSLTDNINTNGIENTYNGNYYSITQISGNKVNNKYSYGSKIRLIAMPNTSEGYNFSYWKINDSYERSQEYVYTIEKDTTITAYFNLGELSITINLYQEENPNIFNIPMGQEKDYVKLWIREYNNTSYNGWEQKPFNTTLSYEEAKHIQIVIEDGEKYEFLSSDFTQYESIPVNQALAYNVYFKEIPEINSIYFGKSDKPYTSGYIDDPNLSFKEEISSIWVGGEQIMGKAPTRPYPYLEDTLLGNTLYIGKNNSFISDSTKNYRNNLNIYKVIIPEGRVNTGLGFSNCSNLTSVVLPKSLTTLGVYAFRGTDLKSLYLPKNIEDLKYQALCDMYNLEKIIFSSNLKTINEDNLRNSKITTMNFLKTNLETIGSYAFRGISNLTTVLLPNTLTTIEDNAFYNDSSLIKVIYNGTIEQWNNIDIDPTGNEYLLNATIYCKDGVI